jgi:hypothetical protein
MKRAYGELQIFRVRFQQSSRHGYQKVLRYPISPRFSEMDFVIFAIVEKILNRAVIRWVEGPGKKVYLLVKNHRNSVLECLDVESKTIRYLPSRFKIWKRVRKC